MNNYLKKQIISYMGNKRKMVPHIEDILTKIKKKCNKEKLLLGDGFSGSGIVSRLFKLHAEILFSNDIAGYSKTLNACYLDTPSKDQINRIQHYIDTANDFTNSNSTPSCKILEIPVKSHFTRIIRFR